MELSRLQELLKGEDKTALYTAIVNTRPADKTEQIKKYIDQYNPEKHDIVTDPKNERPDKVINQTTITYAKLPIPFQKLIVNRRAQFLCANPIELNATPKNKAQKDFLSLVQKVWDENKLDYDTEELAKLMMSETECAEIWYTEPVDDDYWKDTSIPSAQYTLRMRIIATSLGDELYPLFNATGDMIAFGRAYTLKSDDNKDEKHFDLYTPETWYKGKQEDNNWTFETETNVVKKIQVIYYGQSQPEWFDVQRLIEDFEKTASNHSDTNKRIGNPSYKTRGKVTGMEVDLGLPKVYQLEGEKADIEILAWNSAPESISLQQKNTRSWILDFTDTPDISFEQMKGLGDLSGAALERMFIAAHMGAKGKEKIFGKGIQRRINYIKAFLVLVAQSQKANASLVIKPKFTPYLPIDIESAVNLLITANQGGAMSQDTMVRKMPKSLVENPDKELELIKAQQETRTDKSIDDEMNNQNK